jgi:L-aspartate oxidase
MKDREFDVLVIGSGIAGLSFALHASERFEVALITKKERAESNTNYAQGGIAVVIDPADAPELHVRDTLLAGAGLCHASAVVGLVREGPVRVRELIEWGVRFSAGERGLSLGREGGHSRRRIVHAGDTTGREIERALLAAVAEHPRIHLFEDHHAVDLLIAPDPVNGRPRCVGALALDHRTDELLRFRSRAVLLATGGLAQAYQHTTNPAIATGDGVAMAYRAGAEVANLEFVQFHPTALYPAGASAFLITEAVRGEGAVLRRMDGTPLDVDPLAPRDVVARAIDAMLKKTGDPHALLDVTPIAEATLTARFPAILAECARRGIRLPAGAIPVVPAAHYACGGVVTDEDGCTSLPGLYACGEVACTGVHGANRLASNSLLEAVVYSRRAALALPRDLASTAPCDAAAAAPPNAGGASCVDAVSGAAVAGAHGGRRDESGGVAEMLERVRAELRAGMWENAGIVRSFDRLERAAGWLDALQSEVTGALASAPLRPEGIELRNLIEVSRLIVRAARSRHESRGLHFNLDVPYRDNERLLRDTVMKRS